MASVAKKHKAKNSYIRNGGEKDDTMKGKRWMYFTKRQRNKNKKIEEE